MVDEQIIINYIAVWGWMILTIVFLVSAFILFALPVSLFSGVSGLAFIIISFICLSRVIKRKKDLENEH